ncbi:hypothetical protein TcCL_NonESM11773 [Trypanosoma cruzi]|nr:hypothetical protein TcCL_NonESM11773 [Trypanosoma cruzi]
MDCELSDVPAQATRISGRSVSFPDVTCNAYCVSPIGRPPVYMDSDQHLPSHTAGTEDGIPRLAGMLPQRKHVAFFLRDADWNASTSACGTPLATVTTWLEIHRGTIPRGSRDIPTCIWTEWSRPSVLQRQPAPC